MGTINNTARAYPSIGNQDGSTFLLESFLDFSSVAGTSSDVDQMFTMKPGYFALIVGLKVLVKEGATLTISMGDTTHADGFIHNADCNTGTTPVYYSSSSPFTTGSGTVIITTSTNLYGILTGKFYGAASTIDATLNNNAATAKVSPTAYIINMNGQGITA